MIHLSVDEYSLILPKMSAESPHHKLKDRIVINHTDPIGLWPHIITNASQFLQNQDSELTPET